MGYGILSQFYGAMCLLSFIIYVDSLAGFKKSLLETGWLDVLAVIAPLMSLSFLGQYRERQNKPFGIGDYIKKADNPDNFLLNRTHVILSALSVWIVTVNILVVGVSYIVYGIQNFRQETLTSMVLIPIISLMCYLLYLASSDVAYLYEAVSVKGLESGRIILFIVMIFTVFVSRYSDDFIFVIVMYCILLVLWELPIRMVSHKTDKDIAWEDKLD